MFFWWFMLFCNLLIPLLMIVFGRMMRNNPPQDINGLIGYRTKRSMKNGDTWKFAHDYCGRLWQKMGWFMLAFSAAAHFVFFDSIGLILWVAQCAVLIASVFLTERALKSHFTDEGAFVDGQG